MQNLILQVDIPRNLSKKGMYFRKKKLYKQSKKDFSRYASYHGCEYELLSKPPEIVPNPHPTWARVKPILDKAYDQYDFILYVDCDVLVRNRETNIFDQVDNDQYLYGITVLDDNAFVERNRKESIIQQCHELNLSPQTYINAGVVVMGRSFRKLVRELWSDYKMFWSNEPTPLRNDQTFLNVLGHKTGRLRFLGSEWNYLRRGDNGDFRNANFVHLLDKDLRNYENPHSLFSRLKRKFFRRVKRIV